MALLEAADVASLLLAWFPFLPFKLTKRLRIGLAAYCMGDSRRAVLWLEAARGVGRSLFSLLAGFPPLSHSNKYQFPLIHIFQPTRATKTTVEERRATKKKK